MRSGARARSTAAAGLAALVGLALASPPGVAAQEEGVPRPMDAPASGSRVAPVLGVGYLEGSTGAVTAGVHWGYLTDRFELPALRAEAVFTENGVAGVAELRAHVRLGEILYAGGGIGATGESVDDVRGVDPVLAAGLLDRGSGFRMELRAIGVDDPWLAFTWGGFWF